MGTTQWVNWSGRQKSDELVAVVAPSSEKDFVSAITSKRNSGLRLRAVGASHSHSRVAVPEELLVVTDRWQGLVDREPVVAADRDSRDPTGRGVLAAEETGPAAQVARIKSGTRIFQLGEPLWQRGFGLINQGDIDRQSLAGAIATGTHGSGRALQNFSAAVVEVRIVLADGQIVDCSSELESDLFEVARHSLGSVGLVTEIGIEVRPRYRLEEKLWSDDPEAVMADIENLTRTNRHFEFFWMPQLDRCACKALNEVPIDSEDGTSQTIRPVDQYSKLHRAGWSHQIISTIREDLHTEMEFSVSSEVGPRCFAELRDLIGREFPDLQWPLEYRTVAEDDLPISAASGRPTVTISVHQDVTLDDRPLFEACEEVFRRHRGRPHWGKVHYHTGAELAGLYQRYEHWWEVRDRHDPQGRFLNSYVESLRP